MLSYVADTNGGSATGAIHVIDIHAEKRIHSIDTGYCPDIAISPNGRYLFVVDTDLNTEPARHYLAMHRTSDFQIVYRQALDGRILYNVAPTSPSLRLTPDGRWCYILRAEILGDDEARYSFAALDTVKEKIIDFPHELPFAPTNFGLVAKGKRLHFLLSGKSANAVASVDHKRPSNLSIRYLNPSTHSARGVDAVASDGDPATDGVYLLGRKGQLTIWDTARNLFSESVSLTVPDGLSVPLQHLIKAKGMIAVGLSNDELAARGQAEVICLFSISNAFYREKAIAVWPPAEKLHISPEPLQLLSLSRDTRTLTIVDLESGELVTRIEKVGVSPVAFVVVRTGRRVRARRQEPRQ